MDRLTFSALVLVSVYFLAAVWVLTSCLDVSMWRLQTDAWDVVALKCLCVFGSLVLCVCLSHPKLLSHVVFPCLLLLSLLLAIGSSLPSKHFVLLLPLPA